MRILAALLLGYQFLLGQVGKELPGSSPSVPVGVTRGARAAMDRAVGASLADNQQLAQAGKPERRVTRMGRVVFAPNGCPSVQQPFDVLVHFNGAPPSVEPSFERSGVNGVLVIVNLGIGSGVYEDAFQMPSAFTELLANTQEVVREMCPGAAGVKRIAVSAWSAGYGAVWRLLDRPALAARIDAVLLSDGLHAGFEPGQDRLRTVNALQLSPFTLFADRAVLGQKLFAITHSSIQPPYASTTETAGLLLTQQDVPRTLEKSPGPRPGMTRISRADRGGLHVQGFAGNDKPDHCDQLHAMGETLFPYLRERWAR